MKYYFSKYLFDTFKYDLDAGEWPFWCDGKKVDTSKGEPWLCYTCGLAFLVSREWCAKGHRRRHTLKNYKRRLKRHSKASKKH